MNVEFRSVLWTAHVFLPIEKPKLQFRASAKPGRSLVTVDQVRGKVHCFRPTLLFVCIEEWKYDLLARVSCTVKNVFNRMLK